MSEIPKKRQALFSDLGKALGIGDDEAVADLLRNRDPMAIRNELGTMLGQHVRENYDNPLNAFQNKDILSQVPIEHTKLPSEIAGRYNLNENKIYLPPSNLEIPNRQMGTRLHELGHADDVLTKGATSSQPLSEVSDTLKGEGLENALKAFGQHHEGGFFEKEALQKLLSGGKLGLGALGAGALALGAGQKAMAGDIPGGLMDAGAMIDPTGIAGAASTIRDRLKLNPDDAAQATTQDRLSALPIGLDTEDSAIQQNEDTPDKFDKLKQLLGK